jgi:choline kinase
MGYEKDQIISHSDHIILSAKVSGVQDLITKNHWGSLQRFKFIENARFLETNNIYSLWLAREWLKGDSFVALSADVACDPEILPPAMVSTAPITMIVDPAWRDETMKVVIENHSIVRMSKQITEREFNATYIGITVFSRSITDRLFEKLDRSISEGQERVFFNVGVQQLVGEGFGSATRLSEAGQRGCSSLRPAMHATLSGSFAPSRWTLWP